MKLANESRIEELMKFKKDFNDKLKKAYQLYEERTKTSGNNTTMKENNKGDVSNIIKGKKINKHSRNLPKIMGFSKPSIFKSAFVEDADINSIQIKKTGKSQSKLMQNTWKTQYMVGDYFEPYKRLKDNYEMSNWERVNIYNYIILNIQ